MNTPSITVATQGKPRLRGFALISVITALMLTLLLEALDQTIVGTAMPRIIAQLHGLDRYSWVVTAYVLASMTMIPIVGKLSDQFGRKWFLLCGTLLFLITLMTPTTSPLQATLFMVLAGTGIGPFFSLPMVAVQNALPASHLGVSTAAVRYLGQVGATLGIAIVGTAITSAVSGDLMSHLPTSAASKQALSGALTHGFLAVLIFALIALVATFFLQEGHIVTTQGALSQDRAAPADEESSKELVHA
ncbi:MAG TPA: MFS transporter, partial [Ktedonobacteraceae bacterium]|nr:MFS transporter [Ktedonobacteraceae bacterium]